MLLTELLVESVEQQSEELAEYPSVDRQTTAVGNGVVAYRPWDRADGRHGERYQR